ncbi:hypothetical protein [Oceanirhabdus sp. W0125-5]|uniref:hypothetical protein n=1 Tax=Oceanirhabdus sp. W0125-5 TaxID=2999116 RepID=UPI0022F2F85F|nr:hypothetical protein [Oceanirhabdus sp. W0125-5]WBW97706.1 hypothetical protein OW730_02695 [Oceanirhabdus sp. W0125-5]
MKYQLVALFERSNHYNLKEIQRNVCRKLNLYKPTSTLHVPICTLLDIDMDIAESVVCKVLAPYKHFKIKVNNSMSLTKDNKVYIEIDQSGYISTIQRNISDTLSLHGMKLSTKNNTLMIPIANGNYNFKKLLSKNTCLSVIKSKPCEEIISYGKIVKLELWRIGGPRKDNVIMSFPLRSF